jgi:hypothetical protein
MNNLPDGSRPAPHADRGPWPGSHRPINLIMVLANVFQPRRLD